MRLGIDRLWALRGSVLASVERFPVALLALGAFVVFVNLEIAGVIEAGNELIARAGGAAGAAAAIAAAAALYGERRASAPLVRHAISLALALAAGLAIWGWERFGVAPPALVLAAILAVPLAPYIRGSRVGFWAFIWTLINAAALAFVAVIVFCLGLSAIFASLRYLFGADIDESLYGHIWSIGLGFVGPLFALSLIPRAFPAEDRPHEIDIIVTGVRVLSDFVAVPLLATYALILHAYAAKILVGDELPKNRLGWMVLSFGLCILVLRVSVHPLGDVARIPTRLFLRWWAWLLVVPLALLITAAWQRIAAYGLTPQRYGLALFAVFLGSVLLLQMPRRMRGDIRVIPALGAICLFLASFGPWGIISASSTSQTSRLIAHLQGANVVENGAVIGLPALERGAAQEVQSIIRMLSELGQIGRLRPLFEGQTDDPFALALATADREDGLEEAIQRRLNVYDLPEIVTDGNSFWLNPGRPGAVALAGYDIVVPNLTWSGAPAAPLAIPELPAGIELNREGIALTQAARRIVFPLPVLRDAILTQVGAAQVTPREMHPPVFVEATVDGHRIGVLVERVSGSSTPDEFGIDAGDLTLFLRRADWLP